MVGPMSEVKRSGWKACTSPNISMRLFQYFARRVAASYNIIMCMKKNS